MGKEKFIYNTHTLRYEKVEQSTSQKISRILGFVCAAIFTAFIFTLLSHRWIPSPKEKILTKEINFMESQFAEVSVELEQLREVLAKIQERDAYAHRMVFGMDPIDEGVWEGGVGGHDQYASLRQHSTSDLLIGVRQNLDKLKRQMDLQSRSLDTIVSLAEQKEDMLAAIPSIKPVNSDKLPRSVKLLSGFGMRIHPIYKVPKMHYGIDFTAPRGTPIQATGAGKVIQAGKASGYGNQVMIDHGFGYKTSYAHMKTITVKVGQEVKRGQQIGLVGSTGTSTAPHCHYEIIFKGNKVNPIHYCMDGLSSGEYKEMVRAAEMSNQSFD
ncbi:MAG: M23 family metallopeptidase [Lewinellaceae bacterium]|nr:M23 family metallopeptidase [Phaeodactylibacter sp.]MCB9036539.1 M23 family metallopeptidase [Lewinellaceae bacterium]